MNDEQKNFLLRWILETVMFKQQVNILWHLYTSSHMCNDVLFEQFWEKSQSINVFAKWKSFRLKTSMLPQHKKHTETIEVYEKPSVSFLFSTELNKNVHLILLNVILVCSRMRSRQIWLGNREVNVLHAFVSEEVESSCHFCAFDSGRTWQSRRFLKTFLTLNASKNEKRNFVYCTFYGSSR